MADISDWSGTASNNSVASPDGAASGWVGADVGPWARETMAAIQRWYEDPAWVNPTKDISPVGDKTLHRIDSKTMEIRPISGAFTSSQLSYFPAGRIIRFVVSGGTQKVYGVVSSASLNGSYIRVVIGLLGQSAIPTGTYQNNGIEFYGAQESYTAAGNNVQVLGPTAISGAGTTSERDARFGSGSLQELPAGLIWFNSETEVIEVLADNPDNTGNQAWLSVAPLANAWTTKGAVLNIEGKDPALTNSPALYLIAQNVTPGENTYIQMGSRDANGTFQYNGLLQASDTNLLIFGPKTLNAGETASNIAIGGPGSAWEGKIAFRALPHGGSANYVDMTPGSIDAGTLNTLSLGQILGLSGGSSGSIELNNGTTTLLIQWPQESDWVDGGTGSGSYERWTFPTAYASAPAIIGLNFFSHVNISNSVRALGGVVSPTISATYVQGPRSYTSGTFNEFWRSGVPIAIGVPA